MRRQVGKATQGQAWVTLGWCALRGAYFKGQQRMKGIKAKMIVERLPRQQYKMNKTDWVRAKGHRATGNRNGDSSIQ